MYRRRLLPVVLILLAACGADPIATEPDPVSAPAVTAPASPPSVDPVVEPVVDSISTTPRDANGLPVADVTSVAVTGEAGNSTFAVTLSSADTGCEQYADWWEVVNAQTGDLIYRRVLAHSHANEQPFTRSGGPVAIEPDQAVVVRGHMGGITPRYGGQVMVGSVDSSFQPGDDPLPSLETVEPLPMGCAF